MQSYEHKKLDEAIAAVVSELHEWKFLMKRLCFLLHEAWPPTKHSGWTLVEINCAKSKQCTMCPHSIKWRKYYNKQGFIWARGKDAYATALPTNNLFCSKEKKQALKKADMIRMHIMENHKALVALKSMLDHKKQGLKLSRTPNLEDTFFHDLCLLLISITKSTTHSRKKTAENLDSFAKEYPSVKTHRIRSLEARKQRWQEQYTAKKDKRGARS